MVENRKIFVGIEMPSQKPIPPSIIKGLQDIGIKTIDFSNSDLRKEMKNFIGKNNQIRYKFKCREIIFPQDKNKLLL